MPSTTTTLEPTPPSLPRPRSILQPLILDALRTFYSTSFGLPPSQPLTTAHLAAALGTHFHLNPLLDPSVVAEQLLRNHWSSDPDATLSFSRFASALFSVFRFPHGPPLVDALLRQVIAHHRALNHPYLSALAGDEDQLPYPRAALLDLLRNYSAYNRSFRPNLVAATAKLRTEKHAVSLCHDLEEENGKLNEEDLEELATVGIQPHWVNGVPHDILFRSCADRLEELVAPHMPAGFEDPAPGVAFRDEVATFIRSPETSEAAVVGALSVGTEAIVKFICGPIIAAFQRVVPEMTMQEYVFFPLHAAVDDSHASTQLEIARDVILRNPKLCERDFVIGAHTVLDARARLWDSLLERAKIMQSPTTSVVCPEHEEQVENSKLSTAALYNSQASNWIRRQPTCLSDFTGRPRVLDLLQPLQGKNVLDVGCGEGYLARTIRENHKAARVFGIDVSTSMIAAAKAEEEANSLGGINYAVGNAVSLVDVLRDAGPTAVPNMLRHSDVHELFDSAVACFLFNYVSEDEMQQIISAVFRVLRPGGKFVFSVPHPCFPFWDLQERGENVPFRWDEGEKGYFERVDSASEGIIMTRDGRKLNVRCTHKTFEGYVGALRKAGFSETPELVELGVTDELLSMDKTFFSPLAGVPLHAAFSARKPFSATSIKRFPEIVWPSIIDGAKFSLQNIVSNFPAECAEEVFTAARKLVSSGMTPGMVCPVDITVLPLQHLRKYAGSLAHRLLNTSGTGSVLMKIFSEACETLSCDVAVLKMAYFILASLIGRVSKERGALWDVRDRGLRTHDDNVLFSATCAAAPFHTDGSRRDFFPDVVGLLCLEQSPTGGALSLSNACNAYYSLRSQLSDQVFAELERETVVRDLIERGLGGALMDLSECQSTEDVAARIEEIATRGEALLPLRIEDNVFPIFSRAGATGRMRFRYMRDWIESGHRKAGILLPTSLTEAMDALDHELATATKIDVRLEQGQILFTNNHCIAHARESFPSGTGRHMVRVWVETDAS